MFSPLPQRDEDMLFIQQCLEDGPYQELYYYLMQKIESHRPISDYHIRYLHITLSKLAEHYKIVALGNFTFRQSSIEVGHILEQNGFADLECLGILAYYHKNFGNHEEYKKLKSKIEAVYGPIGLLRDDEDQLSSFLPTSQSTTPTLSIEELSEIRRAVHEIISIEKHHSKAIPDLYQTLIERYPLSHQTAYLWYDYAVSLDLAGYHYDAWNIMDRLIQLSPYDQKFIKSWDIIANKIENILIEKAKSGQVDQILELITETHLRIQQYAWPSSDLMATKFAAMWESGMHAEVRNLISSWIDLFRFNGEIYAQVEWLVRRTEDLELKHILEENRKAAIKEKPYLYLLRSFDSKSLIAKAA
jgi:hypothetical protein